MVKIVTKWVFNFVDIRSNDFLKILHIARGNKFIKKMLLLFLKKSILGEMGDFGTNLVKKMMCSYNSESAPRIFLKFCKI